MSALKRPIILRPEDYQPISFPQGTRRPVRGGSPLRRPRRVVAAELWLRRRSLARRAWRRKRVIVNVILALLIVAVCAAVYGSLLWLLGGVAVGWLAHVHVH